MLRNHFSALFLLALIGSIYACSSDSLEQTRSNIENNIVQDTWRITKFIDSGSDELYHFSGYNFTFADDGTVAASDGNNSYMGSWSVLDSSNSDDDSSDDDLDFNLSFNTTNVFQELNDDWDIISQNNTRIELMDISGGNGDTDYLTFEKQ